MKSLFAATMVVVFLIVIVFSFYQRTSNVIMLNESLIHKLRLKVESDQLAVLLEDFYSCEKSLSGSTISTTVGNSVAVVPKMLKAGIWQPINSDYTVTAVTDFLLEAKTYVIQLSAQLLGKEWPLGRILVKIDTAGKIQKCQSYNMKDLLLPRTCAGTATSKFIETINTNGVLSCGNFP